LTEVSRVGDLVELVRTKAAGRKRLGRRYVGLEHIASGGGLIGTAPASLSESVNGVFEAGDVLFGKLRPNLRKSLQVDFGGYCSTDILVLRPREQHSSSFVKHAVTTPAVFRHAEANSIGTRMPRTSWPAVAEAPVWAPRLAEQRRIAEILDGLGDAIAASERLVGKRSRLSVAVERSLFDQVLDRPPTRLDRLASVDRGRFTARPRNDPLFFGGPYAFAQTGDVTASARGLLQSVGQSLNERGRRVSRSFPAGSVAVTIAANIADTAILASETFFPDSVVGVIPHDASTARWVEMCIHRCKPRLEAAAPQSAQKNINLEDLRPLAVPDVPLEVQRRFATIYEESRRAVDAERDQLAKLVALRGGLADDLLTGRVRAVPV
jgi:type I restriction enzyme S subunit